VVGLAQAQGQDLVVRTVRWQDWYGVQRNVRKIQEVQLVQGVLEDRAIPEHHLNHDLIAVHAVPEVHGVRAFRRVLLVPGVREVQLVRAGLEVRAARRSTLFQDLLLVLFLPELQALLWVPAVQRGPCGRHQRVCQQFRGHLEVHEVLSVRAVRAVQEVQVGTFDRDHHCFQELVEARLDRTFLGPLPFQEDQGDRLVPDFLLFRGLQAGLAGMCNRLHRRRHRIHHRIHRRIRHPQTAGEERLRRKNERF